LNHGFRHYDCPVAHIVRLTGACDSAMNAARNWDYAPKVRAAAANGGPSRNKVLQEVSSPAKAGDPVTTSFSVGAQPMTWWLLDAPLSQRMTSSGSLFLAR